MKKTKEMHGHGFYVFEAINSANTHLIENQTELDQFFVFADGHLRNYMTLYDYCVTPVGWNVLVQLKDEASILDLYAKTQERRGRPVIWDEAWLVISNQVRLFRARMTQWTNEKRGRAGNASKTTYCRYLFTSYEEGKEYIDMVRNQELSLDQKNPKYQPNDEHYDTENEIAKSTDQLSSRKAQEGAKKHMPKMRSLKICNYVVEKLERWIRQTCEKHEVRYEGVELQV